MCVFLCVCVCVCPSSPPHDPAHNVGLNSRIPPTPEHDPSPPSPHPYPQAIARPTLGKNYPSKSARHLFLMPDFRELDRHLTCGANFGPYPQYGWDFPEEIPERPRKRSQRISWNFPREYGWDAPNPIIQGI